MNNKLKKIRNIVAENCVTIVLNTHRTSPDNEQDPKVLKNLIKEVKERLLSTGDKREVDPIIERLEKMALEINHSHNLESLILFANADMCDYLRLPIYVNNRAVIDNNFATRDIVRALHRESGYYILVLSQQKVRLIEAFNDKVVAEVGDPFPMENTQLYSTDKQELWDANKQTNLMAEYFNRVDKALNKVRKNIPLPVLICTEEGNFYEYLKVADERDAIFDTYLNKNRLDTTAHSIVSDAWEVVKTMAKKERHARKQELEEAVGSGKFLSDLNDVWRAVFDGRVKTLFIEEDLFQPAIVNGDKVELVSAEEARGKEVVDDIYDEMIETNMEFGGDVVFLPNGELEDFQRFAAITRY